MSPRLLDLLYIPAGLCYLPVLLYQMIALKKNRRGWGQRFGAIPVTPASRPRIWIHAVSLGEVNATRSLVAAIEERLPDHEVVVSATTDTGFAAACKHYGTERVFRYPLDFSFVVQRVLERVRPAAIVLMELEVWPNLLAMAARRGVPVLIANGRVTEEKSMRRFGLPGVRALAGGMFARLSRVGAQDEAHAERFVRLGVPRERVVVTGSMKYDTAVIADAIPGDEALAKAMGIDRAKPLVVAGSTGPGEEAMLLEAWETVRRQHPTAQLVIVPRKPERFDEVARLIAARGWTCLRRSERSDDRAPPGNRPAADDKTVFLGDTMGELRKFYSLADVVFVGRSLVPMGGSDLMEVAALARPMCFGPHTENFADIAGKLLAENAASQCPDAHAWAETTAALLSDRDAAQAMARRARDIVERNRGATDRTVAMLFDTMNEPTDHSANINRSDLL